MQDPVLESVVPNAIKTRFPKGAKVRLRSRGPVMTVCGYHFLMTPEPYADVVCVWFSGTEAKSDRFPPEALIRVKGKSGKGGSSK